MNILDTKGRNTNFKEKARKSSFLLAVHAYWRERKRRQLFGKEFATFKDVSQRPDARFSMDWDDINPQLDDRTSTTGFDRHYVYHPAWAARVLSESKPDIHVDISSTLNFCAIVSAFVPIKFYDYRLANLALSKLYTGKVDLMQLPFEDNSIQSLSCMHVIEHIGLGRYGDPLDYEGDLKAIKELQRVLAPGGNLLFVVPIGKPKIAFNAHRIYSYQQIISYCDELKLTEFVLIPDAADQGGLIRNATKEIASQQNYGCSCFWSTKN